MGENGDCHKNLEAKYQTCINYYKLMGKFH